MKKTDTKEIILSEALKLFAKKGYDAVGVTEIADAVGIKAPSLYKHYKSKRAIFDSILKRMSNMDAEQARDYEMPEASIQEAQDSYKDISPEKIGAYTKAMFLYWTEEEFSSCFRKMLALEQYKSPEMGKLYQQYISEGPASYMADIFMDMTSSRDKAYDLAIEFYGPIYLLYSIYDAADDKRAVMDLLERHIENFSARLNLKLKNEKK